MSMHFFTDSSDAYDACQCDENIKSGDILVIDEEGVIGIAGTWPIAITVLSGALHYAQEGRLKAYLADNKLDVDLSDALELAAERGYPINPELEV